jgi:hypothetical protein
MFWSGTRSRFKKPNRVMYPQNTHHTAHVFEIWRGASLSGPAPPPRCAMESRLFQGAAPPPRTAKQPQSDLTPAKLDRSLARHDLSLAVFYPRNTEGHPGAAGVGQHAASADPRRAWPRWNATGTSMRGAKPDRPPLGATRRLARGDGKEAWTARAAASLHNGNACLARWVTSRNQN